MKEPISSMTDLIHDLFSITELLIMLIANGAKGEACLRTVVNINKSNLTHVFRGQNEVRQKKNH